MMVTMQNGLVHCPKCAGDSRYTPVGLARHWATAHPITASVAVPAQPLESACPLGDGLSCGNCFFAFAGSTKCRFGEFKNRIGDY